jgi:hypothetical protein
LDWHSSQWEKVSKKETFLTSRKLFSKRKFIRKFTRKKSFQKKKKVSFLLTFSHWELCQSNEKKRHQKRDEKIISKNKSFKNEK